MNIKLRIYIICFLLISSMNSLAQMATYQQLVNIDLQSLLGKPVDSLIARLPLTDSMFVTTGGNVFNAGGVVIVYNNNFNIDVQCYDFQYVTPNNPNRIHPSQAWPLQLMRKEKIYKIVIYRGWNIINEAHL